MKYEISYNLHKVPTVQCLSLFIVVQRVLLRSKQDENGDKVTQKFDFGSSLSRLSLIVRNHDI